VRKWECKCEGMGMGGMVMGETGRDCECEGMRMGGNGNVRECECEGMGI